jgi:hypothetical protein
MKEDPDRRDPCLARLDIPDSDFDGIYAIPLEAILRGPRDEMLLQSLPGDPTRNRITYRENGSALDIEDRGPKDSTYLERILGLEEGFHLLMVCYTRPLLDDLFSYDRFNVYLPREMISEVSRIYVTRTGATKIREY